MDLKQLTALVAIADHGSFSAAAKALFTVQSNVSAHIARLERELDAVLVDRARGELTQEGELVATRARRIQAELDAISADLASRGDEVAGDVRLGVIGTTGRWLMPQLLRQLHARHPAIRVVAVEASTSSLTPMLLEGRLDLAVINLPVLRPEMDAEPLFSEEMIVIVPEHHPLAARSLVSLAELAEHPLILPAPGTALRSELDDEARSKGVTLRPVAEVDGVRLLTSLAFEGYGAAIVPSTAVPGWLKGPFARVALADVPRRAVGLARRKRSTPSAPARAVAEALVEVVHRRGPRQPGVVVLVPEAR